MLCPYCNQEMETGTMQNPHGIAWYPGNKRHLACNPEFIDGAVMIAENSIIHAAMCPAYLCRQCGKVIINLPQEDVDPDTPQGFTV